LWCTPTGGGLRLMPHMQHGRGLSPELRRSKQATTHHSSFLCHVGANQQEVMLALDFQSPGLVFSSCNSYNAVRRHYTSSCTNSTCLPGALFSAGRHHAWLRAQRSMRRPPPVPDPMQERAGQLRAWPSWLDLHWQLPAGSRGCSATELVGTPVYTHVELLCSST